MNIQLNGEQTQLPDAITVAEMIERLNLEPRRIAVEINEDVVPRSEFPQRRLHPDDRVEVIHAIGGG